MNTHEIPMVKKKGVSSKLFNFRPVFFSTVFFAFGIVSALTIIDYGLPWWILAFLLPICAIPFCFASTKKEWLSRALAVGVLVISFLLGVFVFCGQTHAFTSVTVYNGNYTVRGQVVDFAVFDEYTKVEIANVYIDEKGVKGKLIAYLPGDYPEKIELSSTIEAVGMVQTNTQLFDENGFRAYAIDEDVHYTLTADGVTVTGKPFHLFLSCRQYLVDVIRGGMDETPAQTLLALLFGETSGMDEGFLQNVRTSGIAHVFAVSGLHFGALFGCLVWIFNREKLYFIPKWLRFVLLGLILLFYGGICGFSSSVTRAVIACLTFYGAWLMGVETDWIERISFACFITLLISPCSLITVGFLLSFGASFGIAFLSRRIEKGIWLLWGKLRALVGNPIKTHLPTQQTHPLTILQTIEKNSISFLSVTFSAQAFTMPIQIYAFGSLSAWSILLNCVFVPIISLIFPFLLAFVILASVLPILTSAVMLHIPNLILTLIALVFETLDFSSTAFQMVHLPAFSMVTYYLALLLCTDKWNAPKGLVLTLALLSFTLCVTGVIVAWI